ncbi:hypothetical protein [Actinopolyspora mzabensis]|uniref:hypothetical protein n=1 Tax=Actinopolyspora mzabensis TaxID=995066 RepID=UPI000B882D26|nr:hypothetical protein [Actinopolyspora mzabensis]
MIALSVAWTVWALPTAVPDLALRDRLAAPLAVVFAGFSVWLVAAELEPSWSTLVVFVNMVAALLRALGIALEHQAVIAGWPWLGRDPVVGAARDLHGLVKHRGMGQT